MIYRVKRFAVTSEIQKEFGIIRKLLEKQIADETNFGKNIFDKHIKSSRVIDPAVERSLIKAGENIAAVSERDSSSASPYVLFPDRKRSNLARKLLNEQQSESLTEDDKILLSLIILRHDSKISEIFWNRCDGLEELSHELGHVHNYRGNLLDRFIHHGARFGNRLRNLSPSVLGALFDVLGSKFILQEEKNASKKGYELLKKHNLSKKELDLARENMENALSLYKSESRISWRKKLLNSKVPQWLL